MSIILIHPHFHNERSDENGSGVRGKLKDMRQERKDTERIPPMTNWL